MTVVSFEAIPANVSEETPNAEVIWKWTVTGDFPEEGIVVNFDTLGENDVIKFTEQFAGGREVGFINSEIVGFDEETGRLQILLTTPNDSYFLLPIANDVIEEGEQTFDFRLAEGEGYTVDPLKNSTLLIISDDNGGPGVGPTVGVTVDKTELTEKGDELTVTFTVDGEIPEGGVTVLVNSPSPLAVADFDVAGIDYATDITGTNGEPLEGNASSFLITITEPTATITVKTFDDDVDEGGIEVVPFNLVNGEEYEVDPDASGFTLNIDDEIVEPRPVVSFNTIAGSFDPDDNILAPTLVQSLEDGSSLLTFVFNVDGEIPEEGLIVDVNSTINLTDYFTGLARPPFGIGGQIIEGIYDPETGVGTGFRFRIDQPIAQVALRLIDNDEASDIVDATFTLEPRESYAIDPEADSSTVTIYDTLASVPVPTVVPEVNFSVSTTDLVESEGTVLTVDFTVDGEIPEGGVLVSIAALQQFLGDFNIFAAEVEGGVFPAPNFRSTGFFFKITEPEASITIPIFPDGESEGTELVTLSLQEAPGYTISPDAEPITLTLTDTATSEIQVSLSTTPTLLIEEEGTVAVQTFTLSAAPPEGGLTVTVNVPNFKEFDIEAITVEGGTIAELRENGFDLTITAQTATVNLPVDDDGLAGGVQPITFTLVDGEGYQISPTANTSTVTIVDDPSQTPPPTTISEPNDIISLAVDTRLSELTPSVSFSSRIGYDNANRYEVEGGFLYVDATEDVDFYKFDLKAGDTVTVDLDAMQLGSTFEGALQLFDSEGNGLIANNGDNDPAADEIFQSQFDPYLEYTATEDGTYYLGVSSYPNYDPSLLPDRDRPAGPFYDPLVPASGKGNSTGEYTINIVLNNPDAFTPEATEIPPSTGTGPAISLFTVAGTYGNDFDNLGFDIVAPGIAETVPEDAGAALNLVLVADGEIPEGGVELYVETDFAFSDYFSGLNSPSFSRGGEFLSAVYDENGVATGFKFRLEESFATIAFSNISNQEEAETDGPEDLTFSLVESAGYTVSPASSSTVTFYDTVEQVPLPANPPEVSLEISPTELIESEETVFTLTLSLDEAPPAGGVQVYVSGNAFDFLNELAIFDAQFTGGVPISDGAVSGFYFLMTEQTATITLPVFNSADIVEGIEEFNVEVRPGAGYTVNPDQNGGVITIKDTPESNLLQITLSRETETLIESEGTVATLNFRLSAAPPEEGVTVTVSNPNLLELDLTTVQLEGAELVGISDDNTSFTLKITEQNASVSAAVFGDDEDETSETVTFTVEAGDGYQVNPEGNEVSFTIYDSPQEANDDTIGTAIATGLSAANASVTFDGEIGEYFIEDEEGNEFSPVDASEDIDFYSFTLEAGETVTLDIDSIAYELEGFPTQRLDSELRLFNAEGVQVASNFDGYAPDELFVANRDPYLEFTAALSGTYYVGVAQWQNRVYDPLTAENSSGRIDANAGRNTGEYTLDINLTPDPDPVDPPVVSLTATPEVVEEGTLVTFNFNVELQEGQEFPAEGIIIGTTEFFDSQFDFNFEFEDPTRLSGIEFFDYIESETGEVTVLWKLTAPEAFIKVAPFDDNIAEDDYEFTLELRPGDDYVVNPAADAATVTITDEAYTGEQYGPVGISIDKTDLAEGDTFTVTLNVEGEIPEGGLEVQVDSEVFGSLGEFVIFDEEGNFLPEYEGLAGQPIQNEDASGFSVFVTENTATLTLDVFTDDEIEGVEELTFSVLDGENYDVDPDAGEITFTIEDDDVISGPVVSVTATPDLITEAEGTPVTFNFNVTGPFPEDGLLIATTSFFDPQFDFNNFDETDPEQFSGIEFYDFVELPSGEFVEILKLTEPNAFIRLTAFDDTVAEEDEVITLSLLPAEDFDLESYEISETAGSASVTISDGVPNLDDPVISLSIEPTSLEEGDSLTLTLNIVDGVIPEGGLEVNVASDVFGSLGEFAIFDAEGNFLPIYEGFAAQPVQNGEASGFIATITEETATITLDVFDDGPNEGKETFTYSLLDGEIYGVDPDAGSVTITIDDGDEGRFTGTTGDDEFDAGVSPEGFNGSNDLVFAGAGDDLIDTSAGLGNNRIYAQSGNDTLFVGSNDRVVGGSGDDILYLLGGGSTVSGGSGADQFWLANAEYPESANTITDFESGVDVLGIGGLGLSFDDLDFTPGNNTLISAQGKNIATLLGISDNQLTADNFTFS